LSKIGGQKYLDEITIAKPVPWAFLKLSLKADDKEVPA
jgi:hypothetical protein